MENTKDTNGKQFGLAIGRFQPFHNGHNAIIQEIIKDGRIPIIILGGKGKVDERHPLSFEERVKMIKRIYPFGVKFIGLSDSESWDEWYQDVKSALFSMGVKKEQLTLYAHNKPEDNKDFEYNGKYYTNASYTEMFRENSVQIKDIEEITCTQGNVIHASDIRKDEDAARRNLDARIYRTLKEKYGWWDE